LISRHSLIDSVAAILGGMARMTIAGAVIMLEACGSTSYLLPLMLTFAAARYTGNSGSYHLISLSLTGMSFRERHQSSDV
jgi:H+/Cl- antiporter ClcA